jgi:hypothetical protein
MGYGDLTSPALLSRPPLLSTVGRERGREKEDIDEKNKQYDQYITIVTTSGIDFQSMIDKGVEKVEGIRRGGGGRSCLLLFFLFFYDCFNRTYLNTASTFGTFFFINHIGFTLFNRFCRAFF